MGRMTLTEMIPFVSYCPKWPQQFCQRYGLMKIIAFFASPNGQHEANRNDPNFGHTAQSGQEQFCSIKTLSLFALATLAA
jgi:hypothetical protein